jgi:hypothetical protein
MVKRSVDKSYPGITTTTLRWIQEDEVLRMRWIFCGFRSPGQGCGESAAELGPRLLL